MTPETEEERGGDPDAVMHVGWGRLLFGNTFADMGVLAGTILQEASD